MEIVVTTVWTILETIATLAAVVPIGNRLYRLAVVRLVKSHMRAA
jgi:hypothetical protein